MAITLVQGPVMANSLSPSFSSNTTPGNAVFVLLGADSGSSSITGITLGGTGDNFAQLLTAPVGGSCKAFIWADYACSQASKNIVISGSASGVTSGNGGVALYEFSGLGTGPTLDKSSTGSGSSSAWDSGTTAATTAAAELWLGCVCTFGGLATEPGAPWTVNAAGGGVFSAGYQIRSSTGTADYAGTQSGSVGWSALVTAIAPGNLPLLFTGGSFSTAFPGGR